MKENLQLFDDFQTDRVAGKVVGSLSTSGHARLGVDVEKIIGIDNGALRIAPLIEAGFGRAVIAYGPFARTPGLAFAVYILNGHNTAQAESLPDFFKDRMLLWLAGSEIDPKWNRLVQWLKCGRVLRTLRQFRWWKRTAKNSHVVPLLDENLAVGWFSKDVVPDPRAEGNGFIMHALGPENGELWAGGPVYRTRALRGVQNLPFYLVAIVRDEGIVYYVSSIGGALGMAPHPKFSPVGVEGVASSKELYLGIQQSVLGQIGWRLDTRLKGVRVSKVEGYESWCGGAHAADKLTGSGSLNNSGAEVGGTWHVVKGEAQRDSDGAIGISRDTIAILDPGSASGLIHAEVSAEETQCSLAGLVWRFLDYRNHWRMEIMSDLVQIICVTEGDRRVIFSKRLSGLGKGQMNRLQVIDNGFHLMGYVNGDPVNEGWIEDAKLESATGVGILLDEQSGFVSRFEAHPRLVSMPADFDMGSPWHRTGNRIVVEDDFGGAPRDLEGRLTLTGGQRWTKVIGSGTIETTGNGSARIQGSVEKPCPGRTAYCVEWGHSDFADLEVTITPPGTQRGEKERSIAGFILYQDPDNYVTLNVWRTDYYGGASISTFFKFNGFEDIYDAIWTNVGDRVYYGRPAKLRLCCDGEQYLVFVDDEPVLYRAFRDVYPDVARLQIRKVGLIGNWEFGTDTGSKFEKFCART